MECRAIRPEETAALSALSQALGNVPFFKEQCEASVLLDAGGIVGFAAAQVAWHAAGSWIAEPLRRRGHTYELRKCLEDSLRSRGVRVYFSLPRDEFEQSLFAKYGPVSESLVQVKGLL